MTRSFNINGETMVFVRGGLHLGSGDDVAVVTQLGLSTNEITISPTFYTKEIHADDFGPDAPVEVLALLASVDLQMQLVHYDRDVLDICMAESMAVNGGSFFAGVLPPAGRPLGAGKVMFASGNHYLSVNLSSPVGGRPWRFRSCYLTAPPLKIPLGTEVSKVLLNWRCIPYGEFSVLSGGYLNSGGIEFTQGRYSGYVNTPNAKLISSGKVLWDHTLDNNDPVLTRWG